MSGREEKFEEMLQAIQKEYKDTVSKMEQLRAAGKIKTATYKQLMGTKIMPKICFQDMKFMVSWNGKFKILSSKERIRN